jgi:hypothetical protein
MRELLAAVETVMSESVLNVGFAEFVAKLIGETFDSIITAQTEQELRILDLAAATRMSQQDFATSYISTEVVDAALKRLCPASDGEHDHLIYEGADLDTTVTDALGVEVAEGTTVLDAALVQSIRDAMTSKLASDHLAAITSVYSRGVSRLVVDSGRISAKLVYSVYTESTSDTAEVDATTTTEATTETESSAYTSSVLVDTHASRVSALSQPLVLPSVRLLVRPVDDRSSQVSQITTNIYGEVELTFKTVTG